MGSKKNANADLTCECTAPLYISGYFFDYGVVRDRYRFTDEEDGHLEMWVAGRTSAFAGEYVEPMDAEDEGPRCLVLTAEQEMNQNGTNNTMMMGRRFMGNLRLKAVECQGDDLRPALYQWPLSPGKLNRFRRWYRRF